MSGRSRFTPEEKAEIVTVALRTPERISEILREKGVSPVTYNRWKRRYITGGLEAMKGNVKGDSLAEDLRKRNRELAQAVGHLYVEIETLKKKLGISR
jgi:transposase-like protein